MNNYEDKLMELETRQNGLATLQVELLNKQHENQRDCLQMFSRMSTILGEEYLRNIIREVNTQIEHELQNVKKQVTADVTNNVMNTIDDRVEGTISQWGLPTYLNNRLSAVRRDMINSWVNLKLKTKDDIDLYKPSFFAYFTKAYKNMFDIKGKEGFQATDPNRFEEALNWTRNFRFPSSFFDNLENRIHEDYRNNLLTGKRKALYEKKFVQDVEREYVDEKPDGPLKGFRLSSMAI